MKTVDDMFVQSQFQHLVNLAVDERNDGAPTVAASRFDAHGPVVLAI